MSAKDEMSGTELDRIHALFSWWGMPQAGGEGDVDGHMRRLQAFATDVQQAYSEAYSRQMETLTTIGERVAGSLQEFLRCRKPQDVIAAEAAVLATLLEGASLQAKAWGDATLKVHDRCTAMAREAAAEFRTQALKQPAETKPAARPGQPTAREPGKHMTPA